MGYYSTMSGEFVIEPEIDESKWMVKPLPGNDEPQFGYFVFENQPGDYDAKIIDGKMIVTGSPGSTVVQTFWEDSVKAYDLEEEIESLARWVAKNGSRIHGILRIEGEEQGDISRVRWDNSGVDSKPVIERPVLTWPDGTVENL